MTQILVIIFVKKRFKTDLDLLALRNSILGLAFEVSKCIYLGITVETTRTFSDFPGDCYDRLYRILNEQ